MAGKKWTRKGQRWEENEKVGKEVREGERKKFEQVSQKKERR